MQLKFGPLSMLSNLTKLARDERGQVLIIFTIMVPVIMGVIGLSLEVGRYRLLNSQLQDLADAAALAGAKQLDGTSGARAAATSAAEALANGTWWSNVAVGGSQIAGSKIIFYRILKGIVDPQTGKIATADVRATSDADASFIQVTTINRGVTPSLLIAVGAISQQQTNATATAGSTYVACNVQPLMLCNPNEPGAFTATAGDLYGFTVTGNTGGYSPGDFSLLDPAGQTHSGAGQIENLLAASNPNVCYVDTVSPAQGQKTVDVASGINVRFDISPTGNPKGIDATTAPNVIMGDDNNKCLQSNKVTAPPAKNPTIDQTQDAMPIDTGMAQVGSAYVPGTWNSTAAAAYWLAHHDSSGATGWPANPLNPSVPATRYQVYQMEEGTLAYPGGTLPWNGTSAESHGSPACFGAPIGTDDRRMISVAVVNCLSQGVKGNSNQIVFPNSYAQFFLTRPVDQSNVIYAEFIQFVTPQTPGAKIHQIVQLYRDCDPTVTPGCH
jgi:Flp pilus assembly protein TadG